MPVPQVNVPELDQLPPTLIAELLADMVPAEIVKLPPTVTVLPRERVPDPTFVRPMELVPVTPPLKVRVSASTPI